MSNVRAVYDTTELGGAAYGVHVLDGGYILWYKANDYKFIAYHDELHWSWRYISSLRYLLCTGDLHIIKLLENP